MDVSDIVEYNASILNSNSLNNSFFCLSKVDPTVGFPFDATILAGHAFPDTPADTLGKLQTKCYRIRCGAADLRPLTGNCSRETRLTDSPRDLSLPTLFVS
jgi:hypothetical protein